MWQMYTKQKINKKKVAIKCNSNKSCKHTHANIHTNTYIININLFQLF